MEPRTSDIAFPLRVRSAARYREKLKSCKRAQEGARSDANARHTRESGIQTRGHDEAQPCGKRGGNGAVQLLKVVASWILAFARMTIGKVHASCDSDHLELASARHSRG
jgi:hypothetical protein